MRLTSSDEAGDALRIYGFSKLTRLNTYPWMKRMVYLPRRASTAVICRPLGKTRLEVCDLSAIPGKSQDLETKAVTLDEVQLPVELYDQSLAGGPLGVSAQVSALDATLSSRYSRDIVLRSMFGGRSPGASGGSADGAGGKKSWSLVGVLSGDHGPHPMPLLAATFTV